MRLYIHGNKKRFWHTFLFFYLITAFLTPSVHSHDLRHDEGEFHHDITLKVAALHSHTEHHTGEWHSDNVFAPAANFNDFSSHDHNSNQHSHFQESLLLNVQRGVGGLEKHKPLLLKTVTGSLSSPKVVSRIPNHLSSITSPSNPKFVFAITDLPPPVV